MKMIVKVTTTLVLLWLATGCSGKSSAPQAKDSGLDLKGKTVYIKSDKAAYSSDSRIAQNIKDECSLDTKLITFIKTYSAEQGVTIKTASSIPSGAFELKVEITDSISSGNAFIGHRKFTSIDGSLIQAGTTIGTFEAARRSGGGAFGGFKGSCAVLGATVKTLGSDVGKWVVRPSTGAALGDTGLIPRRR
jgi:hypothetical protein